MRRNTSTDVPLFFLLQIPCHTHKESLLSPGHKRLVLADWQVAALQCWEFRSPPRYFLSVHSEWTVDNIPSLDRSSAPVHGALFCYIQASLYSCTHSGTYYSYVYIYLNILFIPESVIMMNPSDAILLESTGDVQQTNPESPDFLQIQNECHG